MSHQVLARKWRPGNFREMVGQEHVLKALVNALDRDRLHHAYLFTGTRGVGKTTIARIFARCLNCEQGLTSTPCGECSACVEIEQGRFIDLIEVDAASRTRVEDTRDLLENVQYAPSRGRYKVYLIDEVHMLSNHSFNALLKTLEEPPPHVKFLLATTDPQKLPATVLSRCLQFNLKNMPAEHIFGHLRHVLDAEQVDCDDGALWLLADAARGSMRDALSLTDQAIGFGAGTVLEKDVRTMLGTIDRSAVIRIFGAIVAGDGSALFASIEQLATMGTDFLALLDDLIALLHGIAVEQAVPGVASAGRVDSAQMAEHARALTGEDVQIFYQMALNGRRDFPYVPDPRRGFEMIALRLLTFRPLRIGDTEVWGAAGSGSSKAGSKDPAAVIDSEGARAKKSEARPPIPTAGVPTAAESTVAESTAATANRASAIDLLDKGAITTADPAPRGPEQEAARPVAISGSERLALGELQPRYWNRVFPDLGLTGVTRNIVANALLTAVDGVRLCFVLDQEQAVLFNAEHRQRWQQALARYFDEVIELEVSTGTPEGETPAMCRQREKEERQQAAVQELEQDAHVLMLQQRYGARLLIDTVRPLD